MILQMLLFGSISPSRQQNISETEKPKKIVIKQIEFARPKNKTVVVDNLIERATSGSTVTLFKRLSKLSEDAPVCVGVKAKSVSFCPAHTFVFHFGCTDQFSAEKQYLAITLITNASSSPKTVAVVLLNQILIAEKNFSISHCR